MKQQQQQEKKIASNLFQILETQKTGGKKIYSKFKSFVNIFFFNENRDFFFFFQIIISIFMSKSKETKKY